MATEIVEIDTGREILEVEVPAGMSEEDILSRLGSQGLLSTSGPVGSDDLPTPAESVGTVNKQANDEAGLFDKIGEAVSEAAQLLPIVGDYAKTSANATPDAGPVEKFLAGASAGANDQLLANIEDIVSKYTGLIVRSPTGERASTSATKKAANQVLFPGLSALGTLEDAIHLFREDSPRSQTLSYDVPGWDQMTQQEKSQAITAADYKALQNNFPNVFKPGVNPLDIDSPDFDPAVMVGRVAGVLADPTMLAIPGGAYTAIPKGATAMQAGAHLIRQGGKLGIITGGLTGTDMALYQLAKEGVIDWGDVGIAATIGSVLGVTAPVLIGGTHRTITAMSNKMQQKAIRKAVSGKLDVYEVMFNKARMAGKNPKEAESIAQMVSGLKAEDLGQAQGIARRALKLNVSDRVDPEETLLAIQEIANRSRIARKAAKINLIDALIQPVSSRIKDLNPRVFKHLRSTADADAYYNLHKAMERVNPFFEKVFGSRHVRGDKIFGGGKTAFTKGEQLDIAEALANQDYTTVSRMLISKDPSRELLLDFNKVVMQLDEVHANLRRVGYDIPKLRDFFPRLYKDVDYVAKVDRSILAKGLKKAAAKKGAPLTDMERAQVMQQMVAGQKFQQEAARTSGSLKRRKIKKLERHEVENALVNPAEAIHSYLRTNIFDIQRRKFFEEIAKEFGVKLPKKFTKADITGHDVPKIIAKLTRKIEAKSGMSPEAGEQLERLLMARFGSGEMAPHMAVQNGKNIMYAVTLGNPVAAMTQLGDLVISGHANGMMRTLKSMFGTKVVNNRMLGLVEATEELYGNPVFTKKLLNWSMKTFGFTKVDNFGKSVYLNSTLAKARDQVSTAKGRAAFIDQWKGIYGDEVYGLVDDLAKTSRITDGEKLLKTSDNVRHYLWSQLADVQPIALSEMPLAYLKSPNGRIFYMLRSFGLKQLDRARRLMVEDFQKGRHLSGMTKAMYFASLFATGNASVGALKHFLASGFDPESVEDFPDEVMWNFLQLASAGTINKWTSEKADASWTDALAAMVMPPLSAIVNPIDQAFEIQDGEVEWKSPERLVGLIPGIGKPIDYIIKEQKKSENR